MTHNKPLSIQRGRIGRAFAKLVLGSAVISGATGCAQLPVAKPETQVQQAAPSMAAKPDNRLPSPLARFLEQAPAGATSSFEQTPWGAGVEVTAEDPYFAASGRSCRSLQVRLKQGPVMPMLACRVGKGTWESVRAVTEALEVSVR